MLVFTLIAFLVTYLFDADVDAQGGAYATGVLVLMTSAAIAVTLSARRNKEPRSTIGFGAIAVVFVYTTISNIIERPEGIRIAGFFILAIIVISLLSRVRRSFELHATHVHLDRAALEFMSSDLAGPISIIAHEPLRISPEAYRAKRTSAIEVNHPLPLEHKAIFLEVTVDDSSDFETALEVRGVMRHGYQVLDVHGPVLPNTIATVLLHIRDVTGRMPHVYFRWTEGNPVVNQSPELPVPRRGRNRPCHPRSPTRSRTRRHQTALGARGIDIPSGSRSPEEGPCRASLVKKEGSEPRIRSVPRTIVTGRSTRLIRRKR